VLSLYCHDYEAIGAYNNGSDGNKKYKKLERGRHKDITCFVKKCNNSPDNKKRSKYKLNSGSQTGSLTDRIYFVVKKDSGIGKGDS
jgi:hypothetical protein